MADRCSAVPLWRGAILLAAAAVTLGAGQLQRHADLAPADYVRDLLPSDVSRVAAVSFSPDEQWLAVAVNEPGPDPAGARLLVIARDSKADRLRFSARIPPVARTPDRFPRIAWSPAGDRIAVESTPAAAAVVSTESVCTLAVAGAALVAGFVSETEWIAAAEVSGTWQLLRVGADCRPVQARDLEAPAVAVAIGGAHIAVATADNTVTLYDASTGASTRGWGRPARPALAVPAGGDIACDAGLASREGARPECWDAVSGEMLRSADVGGGAPFSAAEADALVAFTDGSFHWDSFFETASRGVRRGAVYDVAVGRRIASWIPQTRPCRGSSILADCRMPLPFALSPSGAYFAEVRGATVRVYRVKR